MSFFTDIGGPNTKLTEEEIYIIFYSIKREINQFYLPISIYRGSDILKYYLNNNNEYTIPTNDRDEVNEESYIVTDSKSVEFFDVHFRPILGVSEECK